MHVHRHQVSDVCVRDVTLASRCGDRGIATQYEDYMKVALGKSLDVTGRHSLRQMAMLDLRSILVKGDVGTNIVRDGRRFGCKALKRTGSAIHTITQSVTTTCADLN